VSACQCDTMPPNLTPQRPVSDPVVACMRPDLSEDENVRIMVEQLGMSELRERFIADIERGRIDGDLEVVDGPLTEEDKRRLGISGRILDAPPGDGGGER
jgi:hypothetical protein